MTSVCAAECRRCEQSCRNMTHTISVSSLKARG
jgi:hypothetical protein